MTTPGEAVATPDGYALDMAGCMRIRGWEVPEEQDPSGRFLVPVFQPPEDAALQRAFQEDLEACADESGIPLQDDGG